jgi:hypothetical protein
MHAVASRGAFVEVELADGAGCTWTRLATNDDIAKLHVYVKRADLAQVLVKPFEKTFADGTRIALRPGVAVVPAAAGHYTLSLRGHAIDAEIPSASVGYAFTPERAKPAALTVRDLALDAAAKPTLGDHRVALGGLHASSSEARGATALVSIEDRCIAVTVAVASKAVKTVDEDDDELGGSSGLGVLDLRQHDYIPALTPLASPTGQQLAYAAKPIYLMSTPHGKTACIERRLRLEATVSGAPEIADTDDRLRLCAPTARVVHEKLRTASSANGTTTR